MRTTVSGYRLHHLVHRHHGNDVWLGQAFDGAHPVAIKRAAATDGRGCNRPLGWEAQLLTTLDHPNVVELIKMVDDPPDQMLVLSWVAGGSLRDLLDERGTLTPGELVAVLHGVAAGVEHLGTHGMVHGDLRPEHIVLTADGSPVLVGFGAVTTRSASGGGTLAATPSADGSGRFGGDIDDPAYLHPTVAAGGGPAGRSDVFALAVMAYECLTGRVPHRGTPAEVVALAAASVHRPLSSWPSVPPGMAEAVEAALTPDGPDVPVDAAAFVGRLWAAIDSATVVLPRPRVDLTQTITGPTDHETLPFGPTPPVMVVPAQNDAWRTVAAVAIATAVVAVLWFLAGVALGI